MNCGYCVETILPGDRISETVVRDGLTGRPIPYHFECLFRSIAGSVAHIRRECSCYVPGSVCGDPEDMTLREGALAALDAYHDLEVQKGRRRVIIDV